MLRLLFISAFIVAVSNAQMVPQCTCAQIEPCMRIDPDSIFKCGEQCRRHTSAMGLNYDTALKCFEPLRSAMASAIQCYQKFYDGTCAKGASSQMLPKRYPETLRLALFSRVNAMLDRT
ncbi:hypothetical protein COOONC_20316, partial [Cooperia oncophora]